MKITIDDENVYVEPASNVGDVVTALFSALASLIASSLKAGVDKADAAEQFGKRLEELIVAYDSGKAAASHVVQ